MQNLNEIVMRGQGFKGAIDEPGPVAANTSKNILRARMARIISVIPFLLLGLAGAALAGDDDDNDPDGPETTPSAPSAPPPAAAKPARPTPSMTSPADEEPAPPTRSVTSPAVDEPASDIKLQDHPPSRYTVKRGDTLWAISGRFLKNPWKWPDIWGVNRDLVKNPHLIYPGDVIILDLTGATPRLRLEGVADGGLSRWYGYELQNTKLEPRIRSQSSRGAIPTIPAKDIEPFLTRPLIVDPDAIARSPRIVATSDSRVILGSGDLGYATGIEKSKGAYWNLYRPGRTFRDPDTAEELGYEAVYLGDAEVTGFGEISTVHITKAIQEVSKDDRLTVMPQQQSVAYAPHAPERQIRGKVVAGSDNSVYEIAPLSVVILNRGTRDGVEVGHVLGLFRSEGTVALGDRTVPLPEQRYGVMLVFRVFNKLSYAFVMNAKRQVNVNDIFKNP